MLQSDSESPQVTVPAPAASKIKASQLWTVSAITLGAALPGVLLFRPGTMYALLIIGFVTGLLSLRLEDAKLQIREALRAPVTWLATAMLLAFLISAALGINPANSLSKWSELAGAGAASVLMAVILRQMPIEQLNLLAKVLAFATLAMMLLALADVVIGREAFSIAYQGRLRPFNSRLNFVSSAMAVLLPLAIAAFAMRSTSGDLRHVLVPAAVGLGIIATIACGGRSGWAGVATALGVYLAGVLVFDNFKPRASHLAFAALVIALGIGLYWESYGTDYLQKRLMIAQEGIGPMNGRLVVWQLAIDHLGDRPLLGIGLTNYKDLPTSEFRHPHNWVLQLALETGAIGVSLFCAFVGSVLWAMAKTARTNRFGLASIAATAGFLVAGLSNTSVVNMWWLTFFILGNLIGYGLSRTDNPYSAPAKGQLSA